MFADNLLESAPRAPHHSAWTKLASILLQSAGLTVALAISLLHVEHLQVTPPPSIRMTSITDEPRQVRASGTPIGTAPALRVNTMVEPNRIPSTIARVIDGGRGSGCAVGRPLCWQLRRCGNNQHHHVG